MLASRGVQRLVLVDSRVRDTVPTASVSDWLRNNQGGWTALESAVRGLAGPNGRVLVVTDNDGIRTLGGVNTMLADTDSGNEVNVRVAIVSSGDATGIGLRNLINPAAIT